MTAHLCITTYKSPGQDLLKLELCFVGQDCMRVPAILGATYGCQARRLDLSFNVLKSLDGLVRFPYLEELILDNNRLTDDVTWPSMPHLTTLSINKNLFCNVHLLLARLKDACPQLRYLSLLNNCACPDQLTVARPEHEYRNYRLVVLQQLPKLRFLDSRRVSSKESKEAKECRGGRNLILQCPTLLDSEESHQSSFMSRMNLPSSSFLFGNKSASKATNRDKIITQDKDCNRINYATR
uniref:Leucine-rich repeat-containing protein C10orf11 homolog n=1 Tax=Hirondellea gigas TaxID=1518452 RepID=A0A2P2I3W2_9CRUS